MAYGICYTQSGNVKKYERGGFVNDRPNRVKFITGYTVGYPSTAYYPGLLCDNFYLWEHDSGYPPELNQYPNFTEGTAIYFVSASIYHTTSESEEVNNSYMGYKKIYNLMSYTPPNGYVLDKNGPYTYTAIATVYSCNEDIKYGGITNSINLGTDTVEREFRYSKSIQTTDIRYPVILSINGGMVHCSCQRVTWIPGTDNGNFTLGVNIACGGYNGGYDSVNFEWKMKDGINETKGIGIPNPVYSGSGFTTRSSWQVTNSDGNIIYYIFDLQVR